MIRTENLTKKYGKDRGVFDLNLEVPKSTIYGYVGPNGAGKTTTIQILCGLVKPTSGKAFVNGIEVIPKNINKIKSKIGYLPDFFGVYDQMSVWEYLDFFGAAYKLSPKLRKVRIEEVLEITGASYMLDYKVASLSRGMRQKIGISKTMLHDPDILILDEPAGGLDPYARIEMRKTIQTLKGLGKTILLSSHILPELASICDIIGIIEKGKLLIQGNLQEITRTLREHIVLEIRLTSNLENAKKLCEDYENIDKVDASTDMLRVIYTGKRSNLSHFTRYLIENAVDINTISEQQADLEKVFLDVTKK
ncbi:MAG: ABC transporter ATP-binding protein [Verrucomicrobiota bacterium]|nr:ABC transporter ATP-binding protein [Verrucomicrobiota bacterium]